MYWYAPYQTTWLIEIFKAFLMVCCGHFPSAHLILVLKQLLMNDSWCTNAYQLNFLGPSFKPVAVIVF